MRNCQIWDKFHAERQALRVKLAEQLRLNMSFLVGDIHDADLLLVSADGSKLPAHQCILHQRAPGFYERFVEPTIAAAAQSGNPSAVLEVAVGDVDSEGLRFFIRSVYTEDEVAQLPESSGKPESNDEDDEDADAEGSQHTYKMDESTDLGQYGVEEQENLENEPSPQGDSLETSKNTSLCRLANEDPTAMTSFLELATESPLMTSASTERAESRPSTREGFLELKKDLSLGENAYERFINFNKQPEDSENHIQLRKRSESCATSKQIFQMFIGFEGGNTFSEMWRSAPEGIRSRTLAARQLSMNSLTSLTSIDVPTSEVSAPLPDRNPSCKLAEDLLNMYLKNIDTDIVVKTDNGELFAHRCILSATCPYFKNQLQKQRVKYIELKGYSRTAVHFLLSFLYGGLTSIGDDVDVYELVSLGTHLNIESLLQLVLLHFRAKKCHFFHRPCASCVSAIFDALPHFSAIKCLQPLYREALAWQAKHFARIWKGRVFAHLNPRWQKACFDSLVEEMDEETVIDVMLGCERLQASLPYSRTGKAGEAVQSLVSDVLDFAQEFLLQSFGSVLLSDSFRMHGKGLALNIGLMEDVFLPLVHSLNADTAIRSYLSLCKLIDIIRRDIPSPKRALLSPAADIWNPRFLNLVRRLYELVDKHILHYAASAIKTESWSLLDPIDQQRIKETGIFVEMKQPRAPPPKFSSFNRAYKRSSSAGVQVYGLHERASSLERWRPFSVTDQTDDSGRLFDGKHRMEVIEEKAPRRANSLKVRTKTNVETVTSSPVKALSPINTEEVRKEKKSSPTPKEQAEKHKKSISSSPKGSPRRKWAEVAEKPTSSATQKDVEEQRLERQNTQTVISGPTKNLVVPKIHSTIPAKSLAKPKSVVKPMVSERRSSRTTSPSKDIDGSSTRIRSYQVSKMRRSQEKISGTSESYGNGSKSLHLKDQSLSKLPAQILTSASLHGASNIEKSRRRLYSDVRKELTRRSQTSSSKIPRSPKSSRKSTKSDTKQT